MKTNIALIGFMGVGKTAVGKVLAKELDRMFIELDALIEQRAGKTIREIFVHHGEMAFRELEIEVTKEVSEGKNVVIACGGGIVLNQVNIDRLRQKSIIVYLTASPAVILKRILPDGRQRPLLQGANPSLAVQELLRFRRPLYERAADITVNTSKIDVGAVVKRIVEKIKEDEGLN